MARDVGIGGHQSPVNETPVWLTPPEILRPLGHFDLDPCACDLPRPWNCARINYTKDEDGLSKEWFGRVWMNPPYGGPSIVGPWMRKMARHGHGTALIFARTETVLFFETVWRAPMAIAVLFIEGRLFFHRPNGVAADNNSGAPSCLIAYGHNDAEMLEQSGIAGRLIFLR